MADDLTNACVGLADHLWRTTRLKDAQALVRSALHSGTKVEDCVPPQLARLADAHQVATGDRIGIWRREVGDDGRLSFVRERNVSRPHMWAATERIGPKQSGRRRVVLLGESAARGWPLDPFLSCASCLQAQLRHATGSDATEIVDLARAGVDAPGLVRLAAEAAALDPDVYVLFAGNNWGFDPRGLDLPRLAALVREAGCWRPVAAHIATVYRLQLDAIIAALGRALRPQGVPVVFVVPAYCLADWQSAPRTCHPLLGGADREYAERLARAALASEAEGFHERASKLATELLALEEGFSAAALSILGRCAMTRGEHAEAVWYFETSWDLGLSLLIPPFSGFSVRAEHLSQTAGAISSQVVNLPRRFLDRNRGVPTDRRFFFGHVHMTPYAIRLAMADVAHALIGTLGLPPSPDDLTEIPRDVADEAVAQGHFAAALKAGGDDQSSDLLRYHCTRAISSSPAMAPVIRDYVDRTLRRTPDIFCAAAHRLRAMEQRFPVLRHFLNTPPHRRKQRNMRILQAFIDALGLTDPRMAAECSALLHREHTLERGRTDFVEEPGDDRAGAGLEWTRIYRSYLTCYFSRETFHASCFAVPERLRIGITSRVRSARAEGQPVRLFVNDVPAGGWLATLQWTRVEIEVPAALLSRGVNSFVIVWPSPERSAAEQAQEVARAFEERQILAVGSILDMYPVYGEIAECVAVSLAVRGRAEFNPHAIQCHIS